MERMEVDQCACAAASGGGGALRRSNSAPMISGISDGMPVFSSAASSRYRRSSVSVNPSCPGMALPVPPFPVSGERSFLHRQDESVDFLIRANSRQGSCPLVPLPPVTHWQDHIAPGLHSMDSGVTPNSSPSPTRRFRNRSASSSAVRWPTLTPLKRKGGVESDAPPKKLFVAGISDPSHLTGFTVSVSQPTGSNTQDTSTCATPPGVLSPPACNPQHPNL